MQANSIENTAQLTFTRGGGPRAVSSNSTVLTTKDELHYARLRFHRMPRNFNYSELTCVDMASRLVHAAPISPDVLATMPEDDSHTDQTTGMVLDYPNGNKDPNVRETQIIDSALSDGRTAKFILTETDVNTGVFAGGVSTTASTSNAKVCIPPFPKNLTVTIRFNAEGLATPTSDTILIDPFGQVFDSKTGALINGATVTLIDEATGQPAKVFADDGVTAYPSTVVSGRPVTDSGGLTYTFGDGEYRFPMTHAGTYRLKVTPPEGYVAPSLVAPADIPTTEHDIYTIIDASYGKSFVLSAPEPLEVDIPIDPLPHGSLQMQKTTSVREASAGDIIPYQLSVSNPDTWTMRKVMITDSLPSGQRYRKGSTRGAAEPAVSGDGRTLIFDIGDIAPGSATAIRYVTDVLPNARTGEAVNRATAWVDGNSVKSLEASASVRIRPFLNSDALTIVGRVTEGDCVLPPEKRKGVANVRILLEDGTSVVTDRDGLYHIEGARKGRHVVQIDTNALAKNLIPSACANDTRWAGSDISRFIEGQGGSLIRVDFRVRRNGADPVETDPSVSLKIADDAVASGGRTNWFIGQAPGIDWLFPEIDHNPRAPALRVAIKHAPTQRVALTVNGVTPDALAFDGADRDGDIAVSVWTGLPLKEGDNALEARVLNADASVAKVLTRTVHYSNTPVKAALAPEHSRLIADGVQKPMIAVRLTDRDGKPVRAGTMATFMVDQPYVAAQTAAAEQNRQLSGLDGNLPTARVVGDDGIAFVALQPTMQAGTVHLVFRFTQDGIEQKSELRPWLKAGQQKWVVVGFGAGTLGFDTLSDKAEAFKAGEEDTITDGQLAFYAKGRVKGEWLMTMAYDSDRKFDARTGLLSVIDPNKYYTVYGDGTQQAYDAATQRKLYLRLERREYYALFGDFETGMIDTQLARFSRTLNGVKTEYHGEKISVKAFAARSDQRYARDEIRGNGLSGPYRLSASDIIANSDKITLETRDRYRSEKIIDSRLLTRHIDYDIDPLSGTLTFREPVMAWDADRNPIFIVADYEIDGNGDQRLVAGARATAQLTDKVVVGASLLKDESDNDASVAGLDLKAQIFENTELRVEAAKGGDAANRDAGAYLVEVEHHSARADVLAYARRQDHGFGLGQQNLGESGTFKHGIDGQVRLNDTWRLTGGLWQQTQIDSPQTRTSGNARLEYRRANGTVFAGLEATSDRGFDETQPDSTNRSRLLTLGGSQSFLKDTLQLSAQVQFALGGDKASSDFPMRHQISAAYKIRDGIRLLASHEIAEGDAFKAHNTQLGFEVAPWAGAKVSTTVNQQAIGENGARTFASLGLNQSVPLSKNWTVDATFDASQTMSGQTPTGVNPFRPVTTNTDGDSGNGDYVAATVGATYRASDWSWTGRLERRTSDTSDRWGVTSNVLRSLGEGKTVASGLRAYEVVRHDGQTTRFAAADVAIAYRPLDSRWSVLERLELRHENADAGVSRNNVLAVNSGSFAQQTTRIVNNLAINFTQFARMDDNDDRANGYEVSAYYGAKYVEGRFADDSYDGFVDLLGVEFRHDLGQRFDVGFNLAVQHAWTTGAVNYTYGPSLGFSPAKNVWLTAGYNIAGFHDRDFDDSRYTRQGAYVTARFKFDQTTFANAAQRLGKH
ncbi:hypothetical protein PQU92_05795 [Asticcacaulis sp. BYS171W]|uniref:DUF11 domain-containing protein n=1 Tax=Asticcacaulis aquaticus TaxID=2984212 RepID=A0ABT5HS17_9CAUL|nr:hypothetical protein [Asticcacaulis aquaticus]